MRLASTVEGAERIDSLFFRCRSRRTFGMFAAVYFFDLWVVVSRTPSGWKLERWALRTRRPCPCGSGVYVKAARTVRRWERCGVCRLGSDA